jgi:hypothetical protein
LDYTNLIPTHLSLLHVEIFSLLLHKADQGNWISKTHFRRRNTLISMTHTNLQSFSFGWLVKKNNFGGGGWGMGRIFDDTDVRWTFNSQFEL